MIVDGLLCDIHSSRHLTLGYVSEKNPNTNPHPMEHLFSKWETEDLK